MKRDRLPFEKTITVELRQQGQPPMAVLTVDKASALAKILRQRAVRARVERRLVDVVVRDVYGVAMALRYVPLFAERLAQEIEEAASNTIEPRSPCGHGEGAEERRPEEANHPT